MSNRRVINMVVDKTTRTIRPKNLEEFNYILDFFEDGMHLTVTLEPYVKIRSQSQNGLYHKYLSLLAEQSGNSIGDLKVHLKNEYGPRMESGELKSTRDYTTTEMNFMIERVHQFGIELGYRMPTVEEMKTKNIRF